MVAAQADSQDDLDFSIGNLPEGLNVSATTAPPTGLGDLDHLSLKQDVDQFGLAGKIWQSAYMLQSYFSPTWRKSTIPAPPIPTEYCLDNNDTDGTIPTKPFRIVELGAGTGYVGIWLAKMLRQPTEIYITDLEQVLPLIRDNVATHYQPDNADTSTTVHVQRLHWGNKEDINALLADGPIDLVIVSDCVYFPELFELLTTTLQDICNPTTKVVIGYKCRSLEKEAGFWQDYFGRFFDYEPVWKLIPDTDEEEQQGHNEKKLVQGGMLGEEEQVYIFVGSKRPAGQIKAADDTFTTLLFCNIMDL
ncbi:hypothetical protein RO3G_06050 [Lichtheimia corymbifera JMRC:FSU:9682]|uniref:Uncharacterized protein n=1 Tax=Lichtheimia corymbifera JMRC:FSU:9682 TaxID=1263082 RepID=A0A068S9C7_9FUNG|nr:hypothetical protein RO3G_06050 [Lichtheimia corymbifera JMRC:FSU:9682]